MSELFQNVKASVTARQAAEAYGLKVSRNGMTCCPFHHDKTPSMKLDKRYYCFGCGATGDVINLTSQLFGLSPKDSAEKLASDFEIRTDSRIQRKNFKRKPAIKSSKQYSRTFDTLSRYLHLLERWKTQYAPQGKDDEWHPLFCEALWNKDFVCYLLDEFKNCKKDKREEFERFFREEIRKFENRLEQYA